MLWTAILCGVKVLSSIDVRIPFRVQSLNHFLGRYPGSSVIVIDRENRISRVSTTFLRVTNYCAMELDGIPCRDILRGYDSLQDLDQATLDGHDPPRLPVIEVRLKSGEWVSSEVMAIQVINEESAYHYILYLPGFSKQNVSILQRFSDSFMRHVNLGVMLFDTSERLVEISDMACTILGYNRSCIINKKIDELYAHLPDMIRLVSPSLFSGAVLRNHAVHWYNENSRYELLVDSNVLRDESEKIVGAYVIMKDMSNLRSLEAQLHRSDRLAMIGQIAAGTAHEIRNPLTSLRGFIQLLLSSMEIKNLEREVGYLKIMINEIDRINDLVNEFLLLGKPKDVQYRPTSIGKTVRNILPIIESEANLYGITVEYVSRPELPLVIADSELLKQVFLNICKNAIEAMENNNGVLSIVERIDEHKNVHIEFHDTGPGIPHYMMDKIFDPFYTTKENGTGLGLAVCQRIIHDMGGQIRVRSKGYGTTVTITLPYIE